MHHRDFSEIMRNLYVGDQLTALDRTELLALGVKHIVVAGEQLKPNYPEHFHYLHLKIKDAKDEPISEHFSKVNQFIDDALDNKEGVLIHCAFGRSRSCTLAVAYLMHRNKIGWMEALHYLKKKRPNARPNEGFLKQLRALEEQLL